MIIFSSHTNTAKKGNNDAWLFDPLGGEIKNGLIFGRGACITKAGLTAKVHAMKALKQSRTHIKEGIILTGVIG